MGRVEQSAIHALRVGSRGWRGAYERVERSVGLVMLLGSAHQAAGGLLCSVLHAHRLSTLCVDDEGAGPMRAQALAALEWLRDVGAGRPVGVFGAGACAGEALGVAASRPAQVAALVLLNLPAQRLDGTLPPLRAATLLVVGDRDAAQVAAQRRALPLIGGPRRLEVMPGCAVDAAGTAACAAVAHLAADWFGRYLGAAPLH